MLSFRSIGPRSGLFLFLLAIFILLLFPGSEHFNDLGAAQGQDRSLSPPLCSPEPCSDASRGCPWDPVICACACSVVLVDVNGDGVYNNLTNVYKGVNFDLNSDGIAERVAWTAAGSDDAFLVLDRNGNGKIDNSSELFGSSTPQPPPLDRSGGFLGKPNGFLALAELDKPKNGGDGNGLINSRDAIFSSLRLWQDKNHNGISEPNELHTLASLGIVSIEVGYEEWTGKDKRGNWFRYRAMVIKGESERQVEQWAHDVFLISTRWEDNGSFSQH